MPSARPRHLQSEDKLIALRKSDPYRNWSSLDDKRICALCDRTISGRQIDVVLEPNGKPLLRCPTAGCNGGPHEWVYPGNPLTSERARRDWSRIFEEPAAEPGTVAHYLHFRQAPA